LWRRGWPRDAIQALIEQYPQGVGKRYADDKKDLAKDIARSCEKFEAESGRAANEASPSRSYLSFRSKVASCLFSRQREKRS
jgi:hypothetical protein